MKLTIKNHAIKKDLKNQREKRKQEILEKVEELEERPTNHKDVEIVHRYGFEIFRLKIDEFQDSGFRALFDIRDQEVVVFGFMERPPEDYSKETLEEKVASRSRSF